MTRRLGVTILALLLWLSMSAHAQSFPSRNVRLVLPVPAGSGLDTMARVLAERLSPLWGQAVVVENLVGGNFIIGVENVAHATPDGHTLLVVPDSALTVNPHLYPRLPYDPIRDFAPVMQLVTYTQVLVVNGALPVNSIKELASYTQAHPGKVSYASFGIGSQPHLLSELVKVRTGADMIHVPYKGIPQALTSVLADETQVTWSIPFLITGNVKAGRMKALALAAAQRSAFMPEVPTFAELVWPDIDYVQWFGLLAPANTARPVVDKIYGDLTRVLADPDLRQREFAAKGYDLSGIGPDPFGAIIRRELPLRGEMVKRAGAKLD